jgi:hypothetical protein
MSTSNIKIVYKSRDFTPRELFRMTKNKDTEKLSAHNGDIITITGAVIFDDIHDDGEVVTVLSLETESGMIITTNSATARGTFGAIRECFNNTSPITDVKCCYEAKDGKRAYCDLALV